MAFYAERVIVAGVGLGEVIGERSAGAVGGDG